MKKEKINIEQTATVITFIVDLLIWIIIIIGGLFILRYLNLPIFMFFIDFSLFIVIIVIGIKTLDFILERKIKKLEKLNENKG